METAATNDQKIKLLNKRRLLLPFLAILFVLPSCIRDKSPIGTGTEYQVEIPLQTDDGWPTASLTSVGMEEQPLLELLDQLQNTPDHRIHSLLIIKDGYLVFEEYFPGEKFNLATYTGESGFDMYDTHTLCSVTSSFAAKPC